MRSAPDSVGGKLRSLRKESGLGIKTVGRVLDISYTHLSKIENDHKKPSADLVAKLAAVYETDSESLLASVGELPPDIREIVAEHGSEVFELLRKSFSDRPGRRTKRSP